MGDYQEIIAVRFVTADWPRTGFTTGDKPVRYLLQGRVAFTAAHSAFAGLVNDPEHFTHYPVYESSTDVIVCRDDSGRLDLLWEIPMSSNTAASLDVR